MKKRLENEKVVALILGRFRLDMLCPKCQGPIEVNNNVSCELCDLNLHLATNIDIIEMATMSIGYAAGLKKPVKEHRVTPVMKSDNSVKKKSPTKRKPAAKKKRLKAKRKTAE